MNEHESIIIVLKIVRNITLPASNPLATPTESDMHWVANHSLEYETELEQRKLSLADIEMNASQRNDKEKQILRVIQLVADGKYKAIERIASRLFDIQETER